jgi:hypothetical protein
MADCINNLLWTVIPTGLDQDGHARVAVHLAIRLGAPPINKPTVLGSYPDFADWPTSIRKGQLRFELEFRELNNENVLQVVRTEVLSTSSSELWRHLFPPDSPVTSCKPGSAKEADPRTQRTYESYSMRKIAAETENLYVNLAAQSLQSLRRGVATGGDYRSRFAKSNLVPTARPTVKEAREHFAPLNLFQQAEPSEAEKYCLEQLQRFFGDWVHGHAESPSLENRKKVAAYVESYIGKLQPLPSEGIGIPSVRRSLKPQVFKALVERAFKELRLNVEWTPHWQDCAANTDVHDNRYSAANLSDVIDYAIFHRPLPELHAAPPTDCTRYNFNELVSMLGSHPDLYPSVGLVFDLRTSVPVGLAQHPRGRVAARITWGVPLAQKSKDSLPFTAYEMFPSAGNTGPQRFLPCSRADARPSDLSPSEDVIRHGVLDISDPSRFHIHLLDTHSTHYKSQGVEGNETPTSPDRDKTSRDAEVPKLRSCGLALIKDNRKSKIEAIAKRNASIQSDLDAGKRVTFFAEDLTIGLRVDIFTVPPQKKPAEGNWKSLCLRSTTYELINNPTKQGKWESAPIQTVLGSAESARFSAVKTLLDSSSNRGEGIVHSAASRATADSDSNYQLLETICRWENWSFGAPLPIKNPDTPVYDSTRRPLRIRATHKVSKSLPQLEFGNRYYVRCRAAFLDGSGLSMEECESTAPKLGSADGAPFLFQRIESIDSPVVLLDAPINPLEVPGEQSANLVLRSAGASASRHIVPPRVSPYLALLHGFFDHDKNGALKDYMWSEDGSFALTCQVQACDKKEKPVSDNNAIFRRYSGPKIALKHPYLPDPAAQCLHVALFDRRTSANDVEVALHEFFPPQKWPQTTPLKIELKKAEDEQKTDASMGPIGDDGTLTVYLKEGRAASLLLCQTLKDRTAHDRPLVEAFRLADLMRRQALTVNTEVPNLDLHWLLASSTKLDLVHAVEKPLVAPELNTVNAIEQLPGSNSIKLHASVTVDADSTGEFDITASWTDCIDGEAACDPKHQTGMSTTKSVVCTRKVALLEVATKGENTIAFDVDHVIGDTKYHEITYSVNAKSRFAPYFAGYQEVVSDPRNEALAGKFTRQIEKTDDTVNVVHVCNRAAPDPPSILYIVPIFRWDIGTRSHGEIHRRWGGGLRIYVDKPWCSSGNGELLGVLLAERPESLTESVAKLVTQWGIDPLWEGNPLPEPPTPEDFEGTAGFVRHCKPSTETEHVLKGLAVNEQPDLAVSVVGFAPQFDCERKLLYFDVIMHPKQAYYPFVRFALTRFQPNSIADAYLSKVVTADFMQLAPDRWVVSYYRHHKLYVYVYGFTYRSSFAAGHGSEMVIAVERRVQGRDSDFCWVPAIDPKTHREVKTRVQPAVLSAADRVIIGEGLPDDVQRGMSVWRAEFDLRGVSLGSDRRAVVQEVEIYQGDDPADSSKVSECERVVFADAVKV